MPPVSPVGCHNLQLTGTMVGLLHPPDSNAVRYMYRAARYFFRRKELHVATSKLGRLVHRPLTLLVAILALAVISDPSGKPNKQTGLLPPEARSWMALYGADAVTINRAARDFRLPDQIEWKPRAGGGQTANVFGDPSKPGLYLELLKRPPNDWSQPHSHPNERFIT